MYWHENVQSPHSRGICDYVVSFIPNGEDKAHMRHVPFLLGKILLHPTLICGKCELCGPLFLEGQQVSSHLWACRDPGGVGGYDFTHPCSPASSEILERSVSVPPVSVEKWRNGGL